MTILARFKDYALREIVQNEETGIVWVRLRRGAEELVVTADAYFIPPIARQVIRMFPAPSEQAQTIRVRGELAASLHVIPGGKR